MRLRSPGIALLALALVAGQAQAAGEIKIKLVTMAPDGSVWHKALKEMTHDVQEGTAGRVRILIYAGGTAGDEPTMVRKISHRQYHAAGLTVNGLTMIDDAFNVFSIPLFFESPDEFHYVLERMTPVLKERLAAKNFVLLHWGDGGWVHIFSKKPVRTVADLKKVKMYSGAGDDRMARVWKSNGFNPVIIASTDVLTALQTGMIEGLPVPPVAALALQWFRHTEYMLQPGVGPLAGATVIHKSMWNKISPEDRQVLLEAGRRAQRSLEQGIPDKDRESMVQMQRRGLKVIDVNSGEEAAAWTATANAFARSMRETMVEAEIFDLAVRHRDEFRRQQAPAASN